MTHLKLLKANRDSILVQEIMIPANNLIIPSVGEADEAFMKMAKRPARRIFVFDQEGKLLGLVRKTAIMDVVIQRKEFLKQDLKFIGTNRKLLK